MTTESRPTISVSEARRAAEDLLPWMTAIRRDLHQHPELGLEEHRTSGRVCEILDGLGIEYTAGIGGTGVHGRILGRRDDEGDGFAVALRADLDGLPIEEQNDVPYRSREAGRMHACGHDVHTAVLLGAARILGERRDRFPGTVSLLFQPAEETVGGAQFLIAAGALEEPPARAIFGLHVESGLDVGRVGLRYGQRNASSDAVTIEVHGRSCHAAYPAEGVDAIVAAAQIVSAVQAVVSRNVDARDSAVVTFGTIHGGQQSNIVAGRVTLTGTVRTLDPRVRERVLQRLRETVEGVASALGARAEVAIEAGYDALINDDPMVEVVRDNAEAMLGAEQIFVKPTPNMGVEDFAYYLQRIPGAFWSLGVRNEERGIVHPEHSDRFDVDERCLAIGAALQVCNAVTVLERAARG